MFKCNAMNNEDCQSFVNVQIGIGHWCIQYLVFGIQYTHSATFAVSRSWLKLFISVVVLRWVSWYDFIFPMFILLLGIQKLTVLHFHCYWLLMYMHLHMPQSNWFCVYKYDHLHSLLNGLKTTLACSSCLKKKKKNGSKIYSKSNCFASQRHENSLFSNIEWYIVVHRLSFNYYLII